MTATKLGLYELLAPQFLAGFTFPDYIDQYLAFLGVDEMRVASDESGVVYVGRVSLGGAAGASPTRRHRDPSGTVFEWEDVTLDFRLTIPRDGAAPINRAITNPTLPLPDLNTLFNTFGLVEQAPTVPTEYPGVRFRLELLVSALTFHLGSEWEPGEVGDNFRIVPSTDPEHAGKDVRFVLPKMVLEYEQGDDLSRPPSFRIKSWGNVGFDAPHDLAQGELIRMEPAIALHESGRFAFGVDQVLIDLSGDHTPPEILQFFGTDEAFQGLFFKSVRFYYSDPNKDLGLNIAVNDLLISFAGQVSLEASVDVLMALPLIGFDVRVKFFDGPREIEYTRGRARNSLHPNTLTGGSATVPQTAVVQVEVTGGFPNYTISAMIDTVPLSGTVELWDGTRRDARFSPGAPGTLRPTGRYTLVVTVDDSAPTAHHFSQTIDLTVIAAEAELAPSDRDGSLADRPPEAGDRQLAVLSGVTPALPTGYAIRHTPSPSGFSETITVEGGTTPSVRILDGTTVLIPWRMLDSERHVSVDVPDGESYSVEVSWPASPAVSETFELFFDTDKPRLDGWPASKSRYVSNTPSPPDDDRFRNSRAPSGDLTKTGADALRDWIQNRGASSPKTVTVGASASFEQSTLADHDHRLSERRREVAIDIIGTLATVSGGSATGHTDAEAAGRVADRNDRLARIIGVTSPPSAAVTATATLSRPTYPAPPPPSTTPVVRPAPPAPQLPARHPPVLRRLSFRIRLERNIPVLIEFSGELDFETEMEARLRNASGITGSDSNLGLQQRTGASANPSPQDGVVDFKLNVTYDTATKQFTETLTLGAAPSDLDGLLRLENPRAPGAPTAANRFKDIFGALLTFAPIINSAGAALDPGSAGDWAELVVSLGVPVTIGGLNIFRTKTVTLYGGEMKFRQFIPSGSDPLRFTDAGIVFDYGVEFGIFIDLLGINTSRSLKVRYKAVGFNLHFENGVTYQPIFDTSQGYEIDLSDPGLFNLPSPLGDLLKIMGARIARVNPLTLELDFALKVDLGVVTVDRFKVKAPLDPPGPPSILPTGARVNIPNVIVGSGYVNIVEKIESGIAKKGLQGALDASLVPLKLRVAASLAVETLEDLATGRKAIGVYAGLIVEFPSPIPLWSTGLGLYGFSGLFAMHYKRLEDPRAPNDSVSPALRWLVKAEGEPARLFNSSGVAVWGSDFDRWSFGVGLILGTLDTGFVLNLRGMFVLELPGPRILIFVKIQIISALPDLKPATDLVVGILGVIDLDFNLGTLTIGVLVDLTIEELISVQLPIEIFFKFSDLRQWHLYIGTFSAPASALVLNLVRARGYFMVDGSTIAPFPPPSGPGLPGIAIATGIEASVVFGSEDVGLYLRVAAGAHLGVAFPGSNIFIVGRIFLDGELRLFIVSIEAHGHLDVEAPDPTLIHGEICGKVDFFFFSVGGCVSVNIGSGTHLLPAPPMVRGLYLQSHAPVLSAGQGTDRPIDASIGDAVMVTSTGGLPTGAQVPVVPIDTVPVIQFYASPRLASSLTTFTQPLVSSPGLTTDGPGYINVGGGRKVCYLLREITLDPPLSLPAGVAAPPATWRRDLPPGPQGANTNIDLALFSRAPVTTERALERSTELNTQVTTRWGNLCAPVAPPVCVLWTFCRQSLGPSGEGWHLTGIPQQDPLGTQRTSPPPTHLYVEEPEMSAADGMLNLLQAETSLPFETPAKIIGIDRTPDQANDKEKGRRLCLNFRERAEFPNPFEVKKVTFNVLDFRGNPSPFGRALSAGGFVGLDCGFQLVIELPARATSVEVTLVHFARPAKVEAFNADGGFADAAGMTAPKGQPEMLTLNGQAVTRVVVHAPQDETLLFELCFTRAEATDGDHEGDECYRALQLPYLQRRQRPTKLEVPKEVKLHAQERDAQWVNLHSGEATRVTVFAAVNKRMQRVVSVRELDAGGTVINETPLTALSPQPVTGITAGLPAYWLAPPWSSEVTPVAMFLARPEFGALQRLVFVLQPSEKCRIVQIRVNAVVGVRPPQVLIGVVEVCPKSEEIRVQTAEEIKSGEIATVTGYLNGGAPVPLLQPNTTYTLSIRYDAETLAEDGTTTTEANLRQRIHFQTDAKYPARLDPYVLGTAPNHEEKYHFYEDVVKVVFNDVAVVQLFKAYGKNLRVLLHAADGVPMPANTITTLNPVTAQVNTPFYETLKALVGAGVLPCVGSFTGTFHGEYTLPVPLRPLMAYTLDIEVDPADLAPVPEKPILPLYRRAFVTSKFPTLSALAEEVRASRIRHRALNTKVSGLPTGTPVTIATDQEIQTALMNAGEQALPAASETGITVYWTKRPGATVFSPHLIMIDASEPLWRTRSEPRVETVPDQDDPNFKRVVPQNVPALEAIEQSGTNIAHFVHSPGGTRTLAFISDTFNPPTGGATVTLALNRRASTLYGLSAQTVMLTTLKLTARAPWEDDNA